MKRNTQDFACNTYSYTLSHTAQSCLTHLADLGFSEFELMMYPGHLWPPDADATQRSELRRLIDDRNLRVVTLNMPNIDMNIAGASPEMRRYTLDLLHQIVELAGELQAEGVVIGPGKSNPLFPAPRERLEGFFFSALDQLLPTAEKAGTRLWVENMPFTFIPDADGLMRALDRYGSDDIGIVYDVANGHFIKEDLAFAIERCRTRLKLVHLSDTGQQVYRHDRVGSGDVPFHLVPPALLKVGYVRRTMLEIISENPDEAMLSSTEKLRTMGYARS
jgi:sugar phosphate isomerase/epimerase